MDLKKLEDHRNLKEKRTEDIFMDRFFWSDGSPKPLGGIRVLDFTWAWAGPHGTYLLATLGAEVIKIESRSRPDHSRMRSLAAGPSYRGIDEAPWFNDMNPNKMSLTLNLKKKEAIDVIKGLAMHCDVVTENFRPGVLKRLGLDYDSLSKIKPDIIMVSSSLNGSEGPERSAIGYAPNFSALGGISSLTGRPGEPPSAIGGRSDLLSGVYLALAVISALCYRQRTKKAIACSAAEAFMEYQVKGCIPGPEGNADDEMAPHNLYPCKGKDQWISIVVGTDEEWKALCKCMGEPEWAGDRRFQSQEGRIHHREEIDARIGEWTSQFWRDELVLLLQEAGVAAFGSMSNKDLWEDPHVRMRGMWVRVKPPKMKERIMLAPPFHFSRSPARIERPAPLIGEHTEYILKDIMGLSREEIEELESKGVLE
ncbi:MAG: CoA transferase [Candidatus Bathyarchaeia archaeon]